MSSPTLDRSVTLNFFGDWGQANFHRICSWLCQEFCDRAGPRSRIAIWNICGGGIEALHAVADGEAQLSIATPTMLLKDSLGGRGMFEGRPMPHLRALAVLPQNDRMVLAVDKKFGVSSFEELRQKRPALRIATSRDDGTNFIGYVARRYMEAHGIDEATLNAWGGRYVCCVRPDQSLEMMVEGNVDAVLQEAIMTPWWRGIMENTDRPLAALPAELSALDLLERELGYRRNSLPAGFWTTLNEAIPALDFSDFAILVRHDMADDIAHLLTWCVVETRATLERQYLHLSPRNSPLSYPLVPSEMAKTPIPLHPGALRYFKDAGHLTA